MEMTPVITFSDLFSVEMPGSFVIMVLIHFVVVFYNVVYRLLEPLL